MNFLYSLLFIFTLFTYPLHSVYILRFTTTDNGGILFTGNTLGLSKAPGVNQPGTQDSIGAFITIDNSLQVGNYLPGTTLAWQQDSSTAFLDLPANSTVLYAELVWSGSFGFNNQITGDTFNTPVTLIDPLGHSFAIPPDPTTSQMAITPGFTNAGDYTRSADVTAIVQAAGGGRYIVGGVPATVSALDDLHNAAGWTLAVAFQNGAMVTSNLSIFVGAEQASTVGSPPATVAGFCAPNSGVLQGSLFISAIEGDANKGGDHMLFGSSTPLTLAANSLSGPNNPVDNFFASQINTLLPFSSIQFVGSGMLDTRGSFGSYNANATTGQILPGSRQGYDITSVDISNTLVHGQTTAFAQGTTTSDDYMINALGLQIEVGAPTIAMTKQVNGGDSSINLVGDTVTFSFTVSNIGTEDALSSVFLDELEPGLSFIPGSLLINGIPVIGDPTIGVPLGTIPIGSSFTIQFDVLISSYPTENINTFFNNGAVDYQFQPCNQALQNFTSISNEVNIQLPDVGDPVVDADKFVNSSSSVPASVGNIVIFTTEVTNDGTADAVDAIFSDALPPGLVLVPGTVTLDGVLVSPDPDLATGFSIGPVTVGQTIKVQFVVRVESDSPTGEFINISHIDYSFLDIDSPDPLVPEPLPPADSGPVTVVTAVPPLGFIGLYKECKYLNYTRYCVNTSWVPAFSTDVLAYEIYLGSQLIETVSPTVSSARVCRLKHKQDVFNLTIRALYPFNIRSEPLQIEISP